jgi:flagellar biosynthetic protein FlhB
MSSTDDDTEKSHEASQKKLSDARKKGEIPRSADVTAATSYLGFFLAFWLIGAFGIDALGTSLQAILSDVDNGAEQMFADGAYLTIQTLLGQIIPAIAGWFMLPALVVVAALFSQRGIVFAPAKLMPKANRISPLSNAKNKYGRGGLFEFAKSFVKLLTFSACLAYFIKIHLAEMALSLQFQPTQIVVILARNSLKLLAVITLISATVGAIDLMWQHSEHKRKNRMSHKEMRDEHKESEGDPMMKQHRRARAQEISMNRMLADVPSADVVIVNPTHFAVALKWDHGKGGAPICVAKGADEMAARIREIAMESAIPIRSDPPTARALFARLDVGQEVPAELYGPVALAIRFAQDMRQRAKGYFT